MAPRRGGDVVGTRYFGESLLYAACKVFLTNLPHIIDAAGLDESAVEGSHLCHVRE